jgi:hypothetical protein
MTHIDTMGHKISHIMSSNIEVIRICEHCKKQFTARTTRIRYRSHICHNRGYKSLVYKGKVEKSIMYLNQYVIKTAQISPTPFMVYYMIPNLYLVRFYIGGHQFVHLSFLQADTPRSSKMEYTDTRSNLGSRYAKRQSY